MLFPNTVNDAVCLGDKQDMYYWYYIIRISPNPKQGRVNHLSKFPRNNHPFEPIVLLGYPLKVAGTNNENLLFDQMYSYPSFDRYYLII